MGPWLHAAPTMVGGLLSLPARAPVQLEGFPQWAERAISQADVGFAGTPGLHTSPTHTGSWVCYCLGCYLLAALRGLRGQGIRNVDYPLLLLHLCVQVGQAVAVLAWWLQVAHA